MQTLASQIKTRAYLFLILFYSLSSTLWSNSLYDLKFEHRFTQDGLPNNEINMIYQDKDGYIWIATNSGLCQYDSYSTRIYKSNIYTPNALTNNKILCIREDNRHRLWIGTYNGLNVLDKTTGEIRNIQCENISDQPIHKVLILGNNEMLLCCERDIVRYYPDENKSIRLLPEELAGAFPKALISDSKGHIWIGTWNNGLFRYDPDEKRVYNYSYQFLGNIYSLFEDSKHRIWVGSWQEGLSMLKNPYDMDSLKVEHFPCSGGSSHGMNDCFVYDISEDTNTGFIWVGTHNGLSILYDEGKKLFKSYLPDYSKNSISYGTVSCVFRDRTGNMWLGTNGGGVDFVKTTPSLFGLDRLEDANRKLVRNSTINSILVDHENQLWLGLGNSGLVVQNRGTKNYRYDIDAEIFSLIGTRPLVTTLFQSPTSGKIWIGTYDWGVFIFDPEGRKGHRVSHLNYKTSPWLSNLCVYSITEDHKGNTWLGTRTGVCYLASDGRGNRLNNHTIDDTYISYYTVTSIVYDRENNIWAATTNGGILKISGDFKKPESISFKRYTLENNKLNTTNALSLFLDSKNRLWAGTEGGGLNLYERSKDLFTPVTQLIGLPGDDVYSVREDKNNHLWLGTNAGLLYLEVSGDLKETTYVAYTMTDGLQDNSFCLNSAFTASDGEMFFGGHHGYNYFFPNQLKKKDSFPPLMINDIKIHNQSWSYLDDDDKKKITMHAPGFTDTVSLHYRQNNFNIEFAALDFNNPSKIKYAYKLDDYDDDWQYTDASKRFSYYNNLAAGSYTFHLKATDSHGTWNDSEKKIQVVILPPPWKTGWAYLGYSIIAGLLLYAVFYIMRYRLILRNKLKLVALEQEKNEELNKAKLQFFTNITHELRTPLTLIITPLDSLLKKIDDTIIKKSLAGIQKNAKDLLELVNQLLDFRRLETMGEELNLSYCNIAEYIDEICNHFSKLTTTKSIEFQWECTSSELFAYVDKDKFRKIINNLLSNAYKFTSPGGNIILLFDKEANSDSFFVQVSDTGCGIPREELPKIFSRFYQVQSSNESNTGSGIGLHLVQEYVKLHKGKLRAESSINKGSVFTISIPANLHPVETNHQKVIKGDDNKEPITHRSNALKILVVEDNNEFRSFLCDQLSEQFIVFSASNGRAGLEKALEKLPDIIISDVIMPEMSGIELCNKLKMDIRISHIPIIFLTAKASDEAQIEGYGVGADAYITKPFNMDILLLRIHYLNEQQVERKRLFRKAIFIRPESITLTSLDEKLITDAIGCVEKNINNSEYLVEQLSKDLGMDRTTLYRKLMGITGHKPSEFIRSIRLKKAAQLLEKGLPVSEISDMVGFGTFSYFSKCFKEEFSVSPSQYICETSPEKKGF
ncbi:MAG: two-component regulator propeller domain-containing protein [Mangrovibacterium sp.]